MKAPVSFNCNDSKSYNYYLVNATRTKVTIVLPSSHYQLFRLSRIDKYQIIIAHAIAELDLEGCCQTVATVNLQQKISSKLEEIF